MVLVAAGVIAGLAGLAISWRGRVDGAAADRPASPGGAPAAPGSAAVDPAAAGDEAVQRLWTMSFEQPGGGSLAMSSMRGRWVLLNFWATWCPPCVEELPMLDAFHRDQAGRGWQVVGLAIDGPTPVRQFLQRQPVSFPVGLAGLDGTDLGRGLGNTAGGLPFTVVFDPAGAVRERKLGALKPADLDRWSQQFGSPR